MSLPLAKPLQRTFTTSEMQLFPEGAIVEDIKTRAEVYQGKWRVMWRVKVRGSAIFWRVGVEAVDGGR